MEFYSSLYILGSREGRQHEAGNKSEKPEPVHPQNPRKDGGNAYCERCFETERLHDKSGSEGRLLHDPLPQAEQSDAPFSCPGLSVSICMLTIQPIVHHDMSLFTKTLWPAISLLRELGIQLVVYTDDILVMASTS